MAKKIEGMTTRNPKSFHLSSESSSGTSKSSNLKQKVRRKQSQRWREKSAAGLGGGRFAEREKGNKLQFKTSEKWQRDKTSKSPENSLDAADRKPSGRRKVKQGKRNQLQFKIIRKLQHETIQIAGKQMQRRR